MRFRYIGAALGPLLLGAAPAAAVQQDCMTLSGVAAFDTIVSKAEWVPAANGDPAHCLVQGVIEPRIGAGQRSYGTGFELRLPDDWNGRFLFQGGGGWDGQVRPAVGIIDRSNPADTALRRGFVVASTDAGHSGDSATDGWFGIDQKAREDNGYNSVRLVTERGKALIERYYGAEADYSYFMGCSNGGRQGMVAAVRMPEAFDGVLSGAPAFDLTPSIIAWNWNTRALMNAAPQDGDGRPIVADAFTDEELTMVSDAAIAACDSDDGHEDGLVLRPSQCSFDPAVLACEGGERAEGCLSNAQVTALQKIQSGPVDGEGNVIYHGWPLANIDGPEGARAWMLGNAQDGNTNARGWSFSQGWMQLVGATPPRPDFDPLNFDIDDREFLMEAEPIFAATSTDYEAFRENGGKIIWWHPNADPAFSVNHFLNWYDEFKADQGGPEAAAEFSRAYLVPAMHHCAGGPGPVSFDGLTVLVDWVENDVEPNSIAAEATGDNNLEMPLCPYPQHAVPDESGNGYRCG